MSARGSAPVVGWWQRSRSRVAELTPTGDRPSSRVGRAGTNLKGIFLLGLLDLNEAVVDRAVSHGSGWCDPDGFPWVSDLERASSGIKQEFNAYLRGRAIPSTAEVNGFDRTEESESIPVGAGMWRVLLLQTFGRTIDANAVHFPATMAALAGTPAVANVGFSCTEGGTKIDEHRDPNRGALRLQLPIIVPGMPGDCRITVGGEERSWSEGEAVLFDLGVPHSTMNASDGLRVLLVMEIPMPLPFPAWVLNRFTQRMYRHLPSYRGMSDRVARLASEPPEDESLASRSDHEDALGPVGGAGRRTLTDPAHQACLDEFGYAVVPALDPVKLDAVRDAYARLGPAPDDPQVAINWSFHSESESYKRQVKSELAEIMTQVLDELLDDHQAYLVTFITKWPGENGAFAPHQDPSLVDERSDKGVTVWIPLHDTGSIGEADNGMLHVVPGSHRFSRALRVSDVDRFGFADHEQAILTRHGVGVPTNAGEALVFDNALIHYSLPNRTDAPRVVLSSGVRPSEASCVLLRTRDGGLIDLYEIDDDFYINVLPVAQHLWQPSELPVATLRKVSESWTAESFNEACRAVGPAPRTVEAVAPGSPAEVDPSAFCALCGSSEGLGAADRTGRNNAQLVCPSCRSRVEAEVI